LLDGQNA